jgi:hypothetical protein
MIGFSASVGAKLVRCAMRIAEIASAQRSISDFFGRDSETCLPTAVIVVNTSFAAKARWRAVARGAAAATNLLTMRWLRSRPALDSGASW